MRIGCLHTADSNVALFEAAAPRGITLLHRVRPDLLARVAQEPAAALAPDLAAAVAGLPAPVLVTCSSLGPAAGPGMVMADAALARRARARARGGVLAVIVAAPSSVAATAALFRDPPGDGAQGPARVEMLQVPGAWDLFLAGDVAGYLDAVADCAAGCRADVVALAQSSMAPVAARLAGGPPVLTVPEAALAAVAC